VFTCAAAYACVFVYGWKTVGYANGFDGAFAGAGGACYLVGGAYAQFALEHRRTDMDVASVDVFKNRDRTRGAD
jgi:hypothetical protein